MTAADYVTIAVSPALIMLLIGSFVFFLIQVSYQGQFLGRVNYVFALFVFAAVLIGRIAIEEGSERAVLFAIPLALAVFFVLNVFLRHAAFSWMINAAIIAVVWWLAHKLTWDCTVIDDRQDASGEGLLQAAGLAQSSRQPHNDSQQPIEDQRQQDAAKQTEQQGASDRSTTQPDSLADEELKTGWWDRYLKRRSRAHSPGIWVLYLSLVALPVFGLLQRTIPLGATASRALTFKLLVVYVASALGLLLTTAFLALRRYLRQRNLEMPTAMAGVWIGAGAALILAVLIFTSLLPRPAAETPLAKLPFRVTSRDDLRSSRVAPLRDGEVDDDRQPPTASNQSQHGPPGGKTDTRAQRQGGENAEGAQQPGGDENGEGQSGDRQEKGDAGGKSGRQDGGQHGRGDGGAKGEVSDSGAEDKADHAKSGQRGNATRREQDNASRAEQDNAKRQDQGNATRRGNNDSRRSARNTVTRRNQPDESNEQENGRAEEEQTKGERRSEPSQATDRRQSSSSRPATRPPSSPRISITPAAGSSWLGAIAKLLFYLVLAAAAAYLLWTNRSKIRPALAQLLAELRELWSRLWGRKAPDEQGAEETIPVAPRPRPFADFSDPFQSGAADNLTPDELVNYTFAAFEAWSREHGLPRGEDQTARELALRAGLVDPKLAAEARRLADLYGQAAYAKSTLTTAQAARLRTLWSQMRATAIGPHVATAPLAVSAGKEGQRI